MLEFPLEHGKCLLLAIGVPIYLDARFFTRYTFLRDNDLHRLVFMPNGLPDGTTLAYYSKGQVVGLISCQRAEKGHLAKI